MNYIGSEKHLENARNASLLGLKKIIENKEERIEKYYINPNKCKFCNKIIEYKRKRTKFCNSSCAAKYNNKNRKHSEKTKQLIGEKLRGRKLTKEHINKISGKNNGRYKEGNFRREYIIERKCIWCNINFKAKILSNSKISRSNFCSKNCRDKDSSIRMKEKAKLGLLKGWTTRNIISYPEQFFINVLKNNNIDYKHNHPVNKRNLGLTDSCNYFLDFYIENKNIDLEIDGKQHNYRKDHDDIRDKALKDNGYIVYRIKWKNINTEKGEQYIENEINKFLVFYNNI